MIHKGVPKLGDYLSTEFALLIIRPKELLADYHFQPENLYINFSKSVWCHGHASNILELKGLKCYSGERHIKGLSLPEKRRETEHAEHAEYREDEKCRGDEEYIENEEDLDELRIIGTPTMNYPQQSNMENQSILHPLQPPFDIPPPSTSASNDIYTGIRNNQSNGYYLRTPNSSLPTYQNVNPELERTSKPWEYIIIEMRKNIEQMNEVNII